MDSESSKETFSTCVVALLFLMISDYIVSKCARKRGGKNSANIGSVEEIADILRFPKWYDT